MLVPRQEGKDRTDRSGRVKGDEDPEGGGGDIVDGDGLFLSLLTRPRRNEEIKSLLLSKLTIGGRTGRGGIEEYCSANVSPGQGEGE